MLPLTTRAPAPTAQPYLVGINSLRAVAALLVCLFHFTAGTLPERETVPFTKALFLRGYLGVDIFFVISGFIVPYSLLRQGYRLRSFGAYLRRRLVRLNPPAYVAMLLTVSQWLVTDKLVNHNTRYTSALSGGRVLHNIFFTVPFSPHKWLVEACWTLATEFQFYLFLGLLFPLLFAQRQAWWFVGLFIGLSVLAGWQSVAHATFFANSPLFALGGAALLWQQGRLGNLGYGACLVLFTGLACYRLDWYAAATGLGTALALSFRQIRIPGLDYVGRISYSLYLTHVLVGMTVEVGLAHFLAPTTAGRRTLIIGLCVGAALLVAALFYRWVERPFIRLAARQR